MKGVSIKTKDFFSLPYLYDDTQKVFVAAAGNPDILPDLEYITSTFCFDKYMFPQKTSAMYHWGITT